MKRLLIAFLIASISFFYSMPISASQSTDTNLNKFENKVAKKFSRTFCNSTGFGISAEGALKFSIGETKSEFTKNPLIEKVNLEKIKDQIITDIADSCYYFDLTKEDLDQFTLIYQTK